jgi:hypothetical protein
MQNDSASSVSLFQCMCTWSRESSKGVRVKKLDSIESHPSVYQTLRINIFFIRPFIQLVPEDHYWLKLTSFDRLKNASSSAIGLVPISSISEYDQHTLHAPVNVIELSC